MASGGLFFVRIFPDHNFSGNIRNFRVYESPVTGFPEPALPYPISSRSRKLLYSHMRARAFTARSGVLKNTPA